MLRYWFHHFVKVTQLRSNANTLNYQMCNETVSEKRSFEWNAWSWTLFTVIDIGQFNTVALLVIWMKCLILLITKPTVLDWQMRITVNGIKLQVLNTLLFLYLETTVFYDGNWEEKGIIEQLRYLDNVNLHFLASAIKWLLCADEQKSVLLSKPHRCSTVLDFYISFFLF